METKTDQDAKSVVAATVPVGAKPATLPTAARLWTAIGLQYHLAVLLTIGTVVLLAYANSFTTGFALDNKFIILEDPRLRTFSFATPQEAEQTRQNLRLIFTQDYWWPKAVSGLYRPLTTLSYWLNYAVFGNQNQPAGYHWFNFFIHWINACLVYFVVLALMNNVWPALFVACLFAVHPVNVESVTNIVGRGDLLAGLAVLGGFLFYLRSVRGSPDTRPVGWMDSLLSVFYLVASVALTWKLRDFGLSAWGVTGVLLGLAVVGLVIAGISGGWQRVPWLAGMMVVLTFGVFAKENSVVLVGVVALYDFTYRLASFHRNQLINFSLNAWSWVTRGYLALVPPLLAMWYVRSAIFEKLRPPELPWVDNPLIMPGADFWTQRLTAIKVIGKYLWMLVFPHTLSPDYSYNQIPLVNWHFTSWEDIKALIALAAVVTVILVAVRQYHRNKAVFFFILFFFVTLLPMSNLIRIIGSIMAERFLYLPSIGYAGCLTLAVYAISRRLIVKLDLSEWAMRLWLQLCARGVLCLLVLVYGVRAFVRNFDWQDDVTLWTKAVRAVPNSFKSHKSLAYALYELDPTPNNIHLDRIIEEAEKARAITDKTQIVLLHLGAYYRLKGDKLAQQGPGGALTPTPESMIWYQKSVETLAAAVPLDREFNEENRRKLIQRGRRPEEIEDVGNHEIYWNLGLSLLRMGRYEEALEAYQYMRHLAFANPDAYLSIASVQLSLGRLEEAAISLIQTLLLDNSRQESLRLLADLYRQIDREGCAVVLAQGQPRLNVDCRIVARHMCEAYRGLVDVFVKAKQYGLARDTRNTAVQQYKCDPKPFDELLAKIPVPYAGNLPSVSFR